MGLTTEERGALVQLLSDLQLPLRRGMDLMCGLFVVHGEVGNMPRMDGAFVECLDPVGKRVRLRWDEGSNVWLASGEDWEGWHPTPDALPDTSIQTTRALLTDEVFERCTGEPPPNMEGWMLLFRERLGVCAMHRTLLPEARRRSWQHVGKSLSEGLVEQMRERLSNFIKTGECDCDECTAARQASAQPEPEAVGDGVAVFDGDEDELRMAFDRETDKGRAGALGLMWSVGATVAKMNPMALPGADDDSDGS